MSGAPAARWKATGGGFGCGIALTPTAASTIPGMQPALARELLRVLTASLKSIKIFRRCRA